MAAAVNDADNAAGTAQVYDTAAAVNDANDAADQLHDAAGKWDDAAAYQLLVLPKWYDAAADWERLCLIYATTGFRLPYATAAGIHLLYATAAGIDLQHAVITGGRKCVA